MSEIRKALEPFAEVAGEGTEDYEDNKLVELRIGRHADYTLSLGDFRRARAALSSPSPSPSGFDAGIEAAAQWLCDKADEYEIKVTEWDAVAEEPQEIAGIKRLEAARDALTEAVAAIRTLSPSPTGGDRGSIVEAARREEREAILLLIPGGQICDPQEIADSIRARDVSPASATRSQGSE